MAEAELSLTVAKHLEEMQKEGGYPSDEALHRLATQLARPFKVRKEEVAILRVSEDRRTLSFVYPVRLVPVGAIPLNTTHSLATKTIRDKKGDVVNNFAAYKHPTVFETVDLSPEHKATPIQKIISSPMIVDGKVVGVIQISRKARPGDSAGPDFGPRDLAELMNVGTIVGKFLLTLPAPDLPPAKPAKP
jgi:hypothetical protein